MRKRPGAGIMIAAAVPLLLAGCSSESTPSPSASSDPFCSAAQSFQNASLTAARDAFSSGDVSTGNESNEFSALVQPLTSLQSSLPSDAPSDVKEAVSKYLEAVRSEATGGPPAIASGSSTNPSGQTGLPNAQLQWAAKTLENYITEQCPGTLPTDGAPPGGS